MSFVQTVVKNFLPKGLALDIETESRAWMLKCQNCGSEHSVWDAGGIRWKASGNPTRLVYCPQCQENHLHSTYYKEEKGPQDVG